MQYTAAPQWQPIEPREIAPMRERIAEHLLSPLAHSLTASVLAIGKGTIRPATDPSEAAAMLLEDERRRLVDARLFYVTPDIVPLVQHAARNHNGKWDIQPHDLPAPAGFMVFAAPIASYVNDSGDQVSIVGASWGPSRLPADALADGLWVTWWSATDRDGIAETIHRGTGLPFDEVRREVGRQHADLTWDNEIYMPWGASEHATADGDDPERPREIDPTKIVAAETTISWLRVLHAGWIFCHPNSFTEIIGTPLPRPLRRRAERSGHDASPVRVVSIRHRNRAGARSSTPTGRTVNVRYPVAPYMRRQPFGPGREQRRWQLVAGHWRGPQDALIQIRDTVHLVDTAPPDFPNGLPDNAVADQ